MPASSCRPRRLSTPAQVRASRGLQRVRVGGHDRRAPRAERRGCRRKWPVAVSASARASEELDALLRRRGLREEAQCVAEPARGARRRQTGRTLARLAQDCDGGDVTLTRRSLDVVRARRRRGAARCKRLGAPLVGTQPPAARRRLVDRTPDERVPEAKAPWDVGLANRDRAAGARPPRRSPHASDVPAAAAASSGSNGSPATAAPSRTSRAIV